MTGPSTKDRIRDLSVLFAEVAEQEMLKDRRVGLLEVLSALLTTFRHISEAQLRHGGADVFAHNQNALLLGVADVSQALAAVPPPATMERETVN